MLSLLDSIKVKWPKEVSKLKNQKEKQGPAEIWTRIVGFRVPSANRYTTGPTTLQFGEFALYKYHWIFRHSSCDLRDPICRRVVIGTQTS